MVSNVNTQQCLSEMKRARGLESSVLESLIGGVQQVEVDNVGGHTDDAHVLQNERQDVGQIDGTNARQQARAKHQLRRPSRPNLHCIT